MDNAPKQIKDYVRPKVFAYHKHAVSGNPYGVLHYTDELPGPDSKNTKTGIRHRVTDEDWLSFCDLVEMGRATTLIAFLKNRYPPPVDPDDMPLTAIKAAVTDEVSKHSTEFQPS